MWVLYPRSEVRMDMLTAGNQYLRPEYLTPLTTTLDAKKSPLALLAQTCSQIGADPPATKSLLASITSSSNSNGSSSRTSGSSESSSDPERSASSSSATSGVTGVTGSTKTNSSSTPVGGAHEKKKKESHAKKGKLVKDRATPPNPTEKANVKELSPVKPSPHRSRSNSREEDEGQSQGQGGPPSARSSVNNKRSRSPSPEAVTGGGSGAPPEKRAATSTPPKSSSGSIITGTTGSGSGSSSSKGDKLNLNGPSFPPSLFPPFPPTTIPPYLHSYARLKAAASAEQSLYNAMSSHNSSSGLCRDPYCTGCSQLGLAGHHLSSLASSASSSSSVKCPAGCSSCDHLQPHPSSISATSKAAAAHLSSFFPPPSTSALASFYHSQAATAAALQGSLGSHSLSSSPYICNWIADRDSYCGKRFSSSEELLQHLRSHTHSSLSLNLNPTSSDAALLDRYSRTYPTPPLSPLTSGSSSSSGRYHHPHPYSKAPSVAPYNPLPFSPFGPHGLSPGGLNMGHPSFSALAAAAAAAAANNPLSPYFPYALYGHRLGASSNGGMGGHQ